MSFVDVIVGSALVLIIFLAFFALLQSSVMVSGVSKAKAGATAVANSQMEYVRSLSYDAVGTVGGIPAGVVPQYATTTLNGLDYVARTFIAYADDPADGSGGADSNGISTDYKQVRVEVTYFVRTEEREVSIISNVAPPSIETTVGGGTLRTTVVDATGLPVSGATVRVVNDETSPTIDVTTFSNISGVVDLSGAPASATYQIYVSKDGYSSAQTYERVGTNQNPTPGYLTVAESQTTAGTFAIDLLSSLTIRTFSPIQPNTYSDTFNDGAGLVSSANTSASGGALTLSGAPGAYASNGDARSIEIAPAYLVAWTSADATVSTPANTGVTFSVADSTGTLLPDAVLPGNSAGFISLVDLSGVATTTYPSLTLIAELSTSDPLVTPSVLDWTVAYDEGPLPLPDVSFTLTGGKTIGSTSGGAAIYKTTIATTSDATGVRVLTLEWDSYDVSVPGYTIENATEFEPPYEMLPNTTLEKILILAP